METAHHYPPVPAAAGSSASVLAPPSAQAPTGANTSERRRRTHRIKSVSLLSREHAQLVLSFCMITLVGLNDSATGANLSSMQAFYGVSYDTISLVFLSNVAGYFLSCISSSFIMHHLGLNWSLMIAAVGMSSGCLILSFAPPWGVFVFALGLLGFGGGVYDTCLTTVVSHKDSTILMSIIYAAFGVGAMTSPIIIGSFVDRGLGWNKYYYIPLCLSVLFAVIAFPIFSSYEAPSDRGLTTSPTDVSEAETGDNPFSLLADGATRRMRRVLGMRAVWAGCLLTILAFATVNTLSAWIVSFMIQERAAAEAGSRYQLAGLWGGIAAGRIGLSFAGRRLSERNFSLVLLFLVSTSLGIIWAVKNVAMDAFVLAICGFFFGPLTPHVLSAVSARVSPSLKSSAMSLTIGLGLVGSSVGPLVFGVVAGRGGLGTLPAVLIGTSLVAAGSWTLMPAKDARREE